ncbi:hypothetical protein ACFY2W_33460 [Streptomyces sp. NPDC001262]|uniref:hypothetical protein n=1 Tax=unclassified Streptomyces TaxID=2593676 RepID=UPI0036AD4812
MRAPKTRRTAPASAAAALLLAAAIPLAGPATAAHAVTVDVTCTGTDQENDTPGLTLKPQLVHDHSVDTFPHCVSTDRTLTSSQPVIADTDLVLSCLKPFFTGPLTFTLVWNNGRTSAFSGTTATNSTGGNLISTFTGKVTAGEFQGDSAEFVFDAGQLNMQQCAQPGGLTRESGPVTLTLQKL